jgi:hypothetical protein
VRNREKALFVITGVHSCVIPRVAPYTYMCVCIYIYVSVSGVLCCCCLSLCSFFQHQPTSKT